MTHRVGAVLSGLALSLLPASVMAQTVGGAVTSFSVGDWFSLMLRLGLVVGVIWAAVYAMRWYTRRVGGERIGTARALDIVETRALGPNRALHLVRIGGRAVLIGVTPERINALMEVDDPEVLDGIELAASGSARPAVAFGALLAGIGGVARSAPSEMSGAGPRAGSWLRRARRPQASASWLRPSSMDRALAMFGFTPVETIAPMVDSQRHAGRTLPASDAGMASLPVVPVPAASAARARSGYRAAQQSSHLGLSTTSERDDRIAEAQRAIAAAWRKAG